VIALFMWFDFLLMTLNDDNKTIAMLGTMPMMWYVFFTANCYTTYVVSLIDLFVFSLWVLINDQNTRLKKLCLVRPYR